MWDNGKGMKISRRDREALISIGGSSVIVGGMRDLNSK